MTTPEGKTKKRLREIIDGYDGMYTYWPVPTGYGKKTVDVIGCWRGHFFVVETKADEKKPTLLQWQTINDVEYAMGKAFWMAGPEDPAFEVFIQWLNELRDTIPHDPHLTPDPVDRRTL